MDSNHPTIEGSTPQTLDRSTTYASNGSSSHYTFERPVQAIHLQHLHRHQPRQRNSIEDDNDDDDDDDDGITIPTVSSVSTRHFYEAELRQDHVYPTLQALQDLPEDQPSPMDTMHMPPPPPPRCSPRHTAAPGPPEDLRQQEDNLLKSREKAAARPMNSSMAQRAPSEADAQATDADADADNLGGLPYASTKSPATKSDRLPHPEKVRVDVAIGVAVGSRGTISSTADQSTKVRMASLASLDDGPGAYGVAGPAPSSILDDDTLDPTIEPTLGTAEENYTTNTTSPGIRQVMDPEMGDDLPQKQHLEEEEKQPSRSKTEVPVLEATMMKCDNETVQSPQEKSRRRCVGLCLLLAVLLVVGISIIGGICGSGFCSNSNSSGDQSGEPVDSEGTEEDKMIIIAELGASSDYFDNPQAEYRLQALEWLKKQDARPTGGYPATTASSHGPSRSVQRYILALMYYATTKHQDWDSCGEAVKATACEILDSPWLRNTHECTWRGIACDDNDKIIELIMPSNSLNGPIPTELARMTKLSTFDVRDNLLSGEIPTELGLLTAMEILDLSDNELFGTMPEELASMTNLRQLDVGKNALVGAVPDALCKLKFEFVPDMQITADCAEDSSYSGYFTPCESGCCTHCCSKIRSLCVLPEWLQGGE